MDTRGSYLVVKRITLPPSNALVKNAWIYTTGAPYVFVVWCLVECSDVGLLRAGADFISSLFYIPNGKEYDVSVPTHITMLSVCPHVSPCSLCSPRCHHALCVHPPITTLSVCAPTYHRAVYPRVSPRSVCTPTSPRSLFAPHMSPCSLCAPHITMLFVSKPLLNQLTVMAINVNGMPLEASNNCMADVQICEVGTALNFECEVAVCHILLRFCL
jgi:hypothetical protein